MSETQPPLQNTHRAKEYRCHNVASTVEQSSMLNQRSEPLEDLQNKLLFISVFNYGSMELAKNHIASIKAQGIKNYMCFVTDQESVDELSKSDINCNLLQNLESFDISTETSDFSQGHFNKMSYLRYYVIRDLLKRGYDVWYMDVDTVVLADLNVMYEVLKVSHKKDVYYQSDCNCMCTGCALYMNTIPTINLVNTIIANKIDSENDQVLLFNLLKHVIPQNAVDIGGLDPVRFPNGMLFFGEDFITLTNESYKEFKQYFGQNMSKETVLFVHANWMVGNDKKIEALKKYGLWYKET